jgi:hypothetical protein
MARFDFIFLIFHHSVWMFSVSVTTSEHVSLWFHNSSNCIKMMFRSSFPPVVSKRAYLRYLCLCAYSCDQHICVRVVCFFCVPYVASFSGWYIFPCPLKERSQIDVHHKLRQRTIESTWSDTYIKSVSHASYITPFAYKDAISI